MGVLKMEMWFPKADQGTVEKKWELPVELVARMHAAMREDGLDEQGYVIAAIEQSLVRKQTEPRH